jgi:16S rRNA (cytosine967-C5)-methyltransferase
MRYCAISSGSANPWWSKRQAGDTGRYSHPQWWIGKLRRQYPHNFQTILEASNQRPPMTLRVESAQDSGRRLLPAAGRKCDTSAMAWIQYRAIGTAACGGAITRFHRRLGPACRMLVRNWRRPLLDVRDGMRVLDACAAPGGKSMHLLESANVSLTILDNDSSRLEQVRQNLERLQLTAEHLVCGDAEKTSDWWDGAGAMTGSWRMCRVPHPVWCAAIPISNGCGARVIWSSL